MAIVSLRMSQTQIPWIGTFKLKLWIKGQVDNIRTQACYSVKTEYPPVEDESRK